MFGLSSLWISVLSWSALAIGVFSFGFATANKLDAGAYKGLQLSYAQAEARANTAAMANEQAQASLSQATGAAEAAQQQALEASARVVIREVPRYVTVRQDATGCVTWGMLRVHDAAAIGVDPGALVPPAGQSDDACSPIKPSDFAAAVAGNYAVARANAEQLNALEADVTQRVAVANAAVKP